MREFGAVILNKPDIESTAQQHAYCSHRNNLLRSFVVLFPLEEESGITRDGLGPSLGAIYILVMAPLTE
jgi:hypothetical protein